MKNINALIAASLCLITPQIAAAQVGPVPIQQMPSDVRITAGITIPLGGNRQRADEEPRFDLGIAPETSAFALNGGAPLPAFERYSFQQDFKPKSLLSFNLGPSEKLTINGQQISASNFYLDEGEDSDGGGFNVGTALLITGGVIGALVVGFFIACDTDENGNSPCAGE